MKLSTRGRYALQLMIVVARHSGDNKPINLTEIAKLTSISRNYLEQVAIHLKNAGLFKKRFAEERAGSCWPGRRSQSPRAR